MKRSLIITFSLLLALTMSAAEQFVVFKASADVLPLQGASISFDAKEHSCVQRAVANLQQDFQRVTQRDGSFVSLEASTQKNRPSVSILIGTVGVNKQIDQWVKKGELRDLKGKTEKYIIKTIGDQLVIAGSDKRGTVFGIYELSQ